MKVSDIQGYEDKVFGFLKFTDFMESLQAGNLYMNNFGYYIEQEKQSKERGQGDKYEATHVFADLQVKMVNLETGEPFLSGTSSSMSFIREEDKLKPVYCLFGIYGENLEIVNENENYYITRISFPKEQVDHMINVFGEEALFIPPNILIERVEKKFLEKGLKIAKGRVKYDDYTINSIKRMESYAKGNAEIYFWKDKFFEHQNEYRIVITSIETETPYEINIGDISDISEKFNIKRLLDDIEIHVLKKTVSNR